MSNTALKHLYVEFRKGEKFNIDQWHLLHESDGQVYGIDEMWNCVADFLYGANVGSKEKKLIMTRKDFNQIPDFPFQDVRIIMTVSVNPTIKKPWARFFRLNEPANLSNHKHNSKRQRH